EPWLSGVCTVSLHDALPICGRIGVAFGGVEHGPGGGEGGEVGGGGAQEHVVDEQGVPRVRRDEPDAEPVLHVYAGEEIAHEQLLDRKSTRLNSSHVSISYAV